MTNFTSRALRTIALVGAPATGKTTLAESLLYLSGAIPRTGSTADGTTVSDCDPEEKEKQHSVSLGVLHTTYDGCRFHILDAPGYPDYVGEAVAALSVCETAVLCVNAVAGLTFPGRKAWDLAGKAGKARCIVVTHLDQAEIDFESFVSELGEALGVRCLPVVVPGEDGKSVQSVPFDAKAEGALASLREALVEAVVEIDEDAMTRYLEDDTPPDAEAMAALLTRSMVAGEVVPALCVSGIAGVGTKEFLDFAVRCLPSPEAGPYLKNTDGEDVRTDAQGGSAFVFKTITDRFVGKLCLLRVVSGEFPTGHMWLLPRTGKTERVSNLSLRQGKDTAAVDKAVAGDIVAVAKVEALETSDTLCDPEHPRCMAALAAPKPMVARAVGAADRADEVKLVDALRKAVAEDPTFVLEREEFTGELLVKGVSIMHIDSVLRRIKERSRVEVTIEIPRVPLRETVTVTAAGHHRHKKQTGGRGQFGEVFLSIEPAERGAGLVFEDATVGGSVPRQFIPAVEKGIRDAMTNGIIAGHTVVDVTVRVTDGKYHAVDSDEMSFKMAGSRAFRDAFEKAHPVLLEPLLDMEVAVPSRFMGAITSDLTSRRGHITGMDSLGDTQVVKVRVPHREVLTYPTALHSLTSGEGSFTAEFHDYEIMPANVQQEVISQYRASEAKS